MTAEEEGEECVERSSDRNPENESHEPVAGSGRVMTTRPCSSNSESEHARKLALQVLEEGITVIVARQSSDARRRGGHDLDRVDAGPVFSDGWWYGDESRAAPQIFRPTSD